jgi:TATA-binding protein-associated factor Taf7
MDFILLVIGDDHEVLCRRERRKGTEVREQEQEEQEQEEEEEEEEQEEEEQEEEEDRAGEVYRRVLPRHLPQETFQSW